VQFIRVDEMRYLSGVLVVILFLATSCNKQPSSDLIFSKVDSLLEIKPDSALLLLQNEDDIESMNSAERAGYALLLTKAYDKNYIPHKSDSLIQIAVDYFKNRNNQQLKLISYYYLGRVYQDLGDDVAAVEAFLNALQVAGEKTEDKLSVHINVNLASCYTNQALYSRAMERYKKAYEIENKIGEKSDLFFPLREIGNIHLFLNNPDSALNYYQDALDVALNIQDSLMAATVLGDFAYLYNYNEDYHQANQYISRAIDFSPQNEMSTGFYFLKGNVFAHLNQYDSAQYYLSKCIDSESLYTRASSNYALYKIKKEMGNYREAIDYADRYIVYYDSIQTQNQRLEVAKLMNDYTLESHKKEVTARQKQFMLYWIIIFLVLLSLCIYVFLLIDRRKKAKLIGLQRDLMQNRSEILQLQNLLAKSTSEVEMTRKENEKIHVSLQIRQKELSMRLFETTMSYKIVHDFIICRRQKRIPREITEADREKIHHAINEIYIDFIHKYQMIYPQLSDGDLYCCTLGYMGFSNLLIAYLMGVDSNVIIQRKYRIRGKMDEYHFNEIFGSSNSSK